MGTTTTLATLCRRPGAGGVTTPAELDALARDTEPWVERAARQGARLLAFTEIYPQLPHHGRGSVDDYVEPADGGSLLFACDLARKHGVDLVWPRFEEGPDGRYNVSIYIDRHGEVLGRYRKMFPTLGEFDSGILPGREPVVVETDFGRVGFAICFDLNYSEVREGYAALEPDVIVFSSMYRGGLKCEYWALETGAYLVSSYGCDLGKIVDRGGRVVAQPGYECLAAARVNLNSVQLHIDYNAEKLDAMLARYPGELSFAFSTPEGRYVIGSDRVPIAELVREFDLLTLNGYWAQVRARRDSLLARESG